MNSEVAITPKEDLSTEIQDLLQNSEIQELTRVVRKNIGLAIVYGEQHTTQGFSEAEDSEKSFVGELDKLDDSIVNPKIEKAKEEHAETIDMYGITDDDLRGMFEKVWIYSRLKNPTNELLEEAISTLEGTEATAVFSSGLAAISAVVDQFVPAHIFIPKKGLLDSVRNKLAKLVPSVVKSKNNGEYIKGGKVVVIGAIYGGTYAQMQHTFKGTGRQFEHLTINQFLKEGLPEDADMVFFEASNNPNLNVAPIAEIVEEAKRVGAVTVCDNTFTPITVKPSELGVSLTVHSMTKSIGGRSEDLGGSVSGNTEMISRFLGLHDGERMLRGGVLAPRVAKEFLKNMEDLPERLYIAAGQARALKDVAEKHSIKAKLTEDDKRFAGIRSDVPKELGNGMVNITFDSAEEAHAFVDAMIEEEIGLNAVSLGATTTYYSIPAETTHSEMPAEEQIKANIEPSMVRVSCGTEEDLVAKFEKVIRKIKGISEEDSSPLARSFFHKTGQILQKVA